MLWMKPREESPMKILALEFSGELRSVALHVAGEKPAQIQETAPRQRGPLALVDELLRSTGVEREEIQCLAVALGPGSYTGIRSAIALAQGWELALGVPLLGVSSIEALAALALARGFQGELVLLVDAQRTEFYLAQYRAGPGGVEMRKPLQLVGRSTVLELQQQGAVLLGADASCVAAGAILLRPEASMVAQLASGRQDFVAGDELEPIYLRETQFVKAPPLRPIPELE
jgi:tRNA threonylcarbamoyladenosine biosynthesis protein TsaB